MAYLSVDEFKDETIAPAGMLAEIALSSPNWLARQLEKKSGWIDSRLRKRYAAPFAAPYPEAVKDWLTCIVTHLCYLKRGYDPTDEQGADVADERKRAEAEVLEAADSEKGLFDLPLRQDTTASGIAKAGTQGVAQASPYAWTGDQRRRGRADDERSRNNG